MKNLCFDQVRAQELIILFPFRTKYNLAYFSFSYLLINDLLLGVSICYIRFEIFYKVFLGNPDKCVHVQKKLSEFISAYSNIKVHGVSVKDFNKKIICHSYLLFVTKTKEKTIVAMV